MCKDITSWKFTSELCKLIKENGYDLSLKL